MEFFYELFNFNNSEVKIGRLLSAFKMLAKVKISKKIKLNQNRSNVENKAADFQHDKHIDTADIEKLDEIVTHHHDLSIISNFVIGTHDISFLLKFSRYISMPFFAEWISLRDCGNLDTAFCNELSRGAFLSITTTSVVERIIMHHTNYIVASSSLFSWLKNRKIIIEGGIIGLEFTDDYLQTVQESIGDIEALNYTFKKLQFVKITAVQENTFPTIVEIIWLLLDYLMSFIMTNSIHPVSDIPNAIAACCPNIISVDFTNCLYLSEQSVINICRYCVFIETLKLANCIQMSENVIYAMAINARSLRNIDLSGCTKIKKNEIMLLAYYHRVPLRTISIANIRLSDFALNMLIIHCGSDLKTLDISVVAITTVDSSPDLSDLLPFITDESIRHITNEKCPCLTDLNISGCVKVSDVGVKSLALNLPRLQSLNISHLYSLTTDSLDALAEYSQRLQHLSMTNNNDQFDKQSIAHLMSKRKNLQLVIGDGIVVAAQAIIDQLKLSTAENKLHILDVSNSKFDCDDLIPAVNSYCSYLNDINLSDCVYSDDLLSAIAMHCVHLVKINLSNNKTISDDSVTQLVKYCTAIESMILTGCMNLTSNSLCAIGTWCKHIHTLHIPENVRHISIDSIEFVLLHCHDLRVVYMTYKHTTSDMWRGRYSIVHTFAEDLVQFKLRRAKNNGDNYSDDYNDNMNSSDNSSNNSSNSSIANSNTNNRLPKETMELLKRRQVVFKWQLSEYGSF